MNINRKFFILFTVTFGLFILMVALVYQLAKPNVNEVIDQTIQEQDNDLWEEMGDENSSAEIPQDKNNTEDERIPDQVKDGIVESVIQIVDFFFQREFDVLAIGDSLTRGVGDSTGNGGYIGILDQAINQEEQVVAFDNYGKTGNRSDQLLLRLDEPEITESVKKSEIILITIGANDIMQVAKENFTNLTYDLFEKEMLNFEGRLKTIFKKIQEKNPNAHIYLLGIYNPFQEYFGDIKELDQIVNNWNETSASVVESFENSTFIPVKDLFEDSSEHLLSDDHFHPNHTGYRLIAERVLEFLTSQKKG